MAVQITIIGLGQIGASIGLALGPYKEAIKRVGHDKKPGIAKEAQAKGAVDEVHLNLPASVRGSDLVVLAVPLNELRETLEIIAPDLKEDALVVDTAPLKEIVAIWVKDLLPAGRFHVGLVPSIGPDHLLDLGAGPRYARADLFKEGVFLVCPSSGATEKAVKKATDLLELLGASPMFADPIEADGIMAALHVLPQLLSVGFLEATVGQPGWKEARKLAGRPFAMTAAAALYHDQAEALREAVLNNRVNVLRVLDNAIAALQNLRENLDKADGELAERISAAYTGGVTWLEERLRADWLSEDIEEIKVPSFGERMQQTFLGSLMAPNLDKKKKK
ncbi:MAG: prephenate dehydrogenase [Chloroflexota bacterium]